MTSAPCVDAFCSILAQNACNSLVRHGSNARDSSSPPARSSPVILSEAKDLAAARDGPFAEFTLSGAHVLRVTGIISKYRGRLASGWQLQPTVLQCKSDRL